MIEYGDYSHVREGMIIEIDNHRVLVEYIFWGPYDEDPQMYRQWCVDDELTPLEDQEKKEEIMEEHQSFSGHVNGPVSSRRYKELQIKEKSKCES